jgi:RNA-directed DNA polymerase
VKRAGNLWPRLTAWQNLLECARLAALGKRKRPDVAWYLHELEANLCRLQGSLLDGTYRPAGYRTFWIRDPKPRQISAAPFRDRVVHHALTRILEPVFEPRFSDFSFASRKGFGQHKALALARRACRTHRYVLKCDIRKYFPSIDHAILQELLERAVKCPETLRLASLIIDGSNPQEEAAAYFPGDNLFTPFERRRGLPIGNQTSQFFANVYLNPLDQFVLRELQPAVYLRYVDDCAPRAQRAEEGPKCVTVLSMREGPSEPACRSRFQTTSGGYGQKPWS